MTEGADFSPLHDITQEYREQINSYISTGICESLCSLFMPGLMLKAMLGVYGLRELLTEA